jgi:hypothetical protein
LQVFCDLEKPPADRRTTFTRQRSLVRNQHRPLRKSAVLQAKPRSSVKVGVPPSTLLTTVGIPTVDPVLHGVHLRRDYRRASGKPCAITPRSVVGQFCEIRSFRMRVIGILTGPVLRLMAEPVSAYSYTRNPGSGVRPVANPLGKGQTASSPCTTMAIICQLSWSGLGVRARRRSPRRGPSIVGTNRPVERFFGRSASGGC